MPYIARFSIALMWFCATDGLSSGIAFVEVPMPEQVPGLVAELRSGSVDQRQIAAQRLSSMNRSDVADDVVNALWAATKDPDVHVRLSATWALSRYSPDDVRLPPLILTLFNLEDSTIDSSMVRETVRECVARLGSRAKFIVPAVIQELEAKYTNLDCDPSTWTLIGMLGDIGPGSKDATSVLVRILTDDSVSLRMRAHVAECLGRIKNPDEKVIAALADSALMLVTVNKSRPHLSLVIDCHRTDDPSVELRWQAVRALGSMGGDAEAVVPTLLEVLQKDTGLYHYHEHFSNDDREWVVSEVCTTVVEAAAESLAKISWDSKKVSRALRRRLRQLYRDVDFNKHTRARVRVGIAGALSYIDIDDAEALTVIRDAIRFGDVGAQECAARWANLARLDDPGLVAALREVAADEGLLGHYARKALHRIDGLESRDVQPPHDEGDPFDFE